MDNDNNMLTELLTKYIINYVTNSNAQGVVIGISGGLDSTVSAYLAKLALGKERVLGLILPYKESSVQSKLDARLVVNALGIDYLEIDLSPQIDAYFSRFPEKDKLRIGNKIARERMSILYDYSVKQNYLVMGTGNKTEWLLGYFTIWGDTGVAFEPLGDLYKTTVWELGKHLGIPQSIIKKAPSADLWPGQTDFLDLGYQYDDIDKVLYYYWERKWTTEKLIKEGFREPMVSKITELVQRNSFKRRLPDILQLQQIISAPF